VTRLPRPRVALGNDLSDDPRAVRVSAAEQQMEADRPIVREVFAGTPLASDNARIDAVLRSRAQIFQQWGKASKAFLTIGRELLRLREQLSHEENLALRRGATRLLPFPDSMVSKFVEIAKAVDDGRIPEDRLPGGYSVAYALSVALKDQEGRRLAAERNLIRADVQRTEIIALRREIRDVPPLPSGPTTRLIEGSLAPDGEDDGSTLIDRIALRRRYAALTAERTQVTARLADLDRELALVVEQLALTGGQHDPEASAE